MSLSGDRALVGAQWDDVLDTELAGSAYVFERQTDGTWTQVAQLTASDGRSVDKFGVSVALFGERALVGAGWEDEAEEEDAGAAYVFERQADGSWAEVAKLTASDGAEFDNFGISVALFAERALVGAWLDDDLEASSGAAYVFERQADGRWDQVAKLTATDGSEVDVFGASVALSADRALVGARQDDDLGAESGSAYVFERQVDGTWDQVAKLTASDGSGSAEFGVSVALSGDRALVGAWLDGEPQFHPGAAYVFERQADGSWSEVAKLVPSDGAEHSEFGVSVALSADRALIGASEDRSPFGLGSAYLFKRQADGTWAEVAKLAAADGAEADVFGGSVALSGKRALVGAREDDDLGRDSGSAYVYLLEGCVLDLRLDPRAVRIGEELRIGVVLEHNRAEAVTVPLRVWVEDAAGVVLAGLTTPPHTFRHGDTLHRELTLRIPEGTPPGRYRVVVGVRKMQQGIAWAAMPFQVVE